MSIFVACALIIALALIGLAAWAWWRAWQRRRALAYYHEAMKRWAALPPPPLSPAQRRWLKQHELARMRPLDHDLTV